MEYKVPVVLPDEKRTAAKVLELAQDPAVITGVGKANNYALSELVKKHLPWLVAELERAHSISRDALALIEKQETTNRSLAVRLEVRTRELVAAQHELTAASGKAALNTIQAEIYNDDMPEGMRSALVKVLQTTTRELKELRKGLARRFSMKNAQLTIWAIYRHADRGLEDAAFHGDPGYFVQQHRIIKDGISVLPAGPQRIETLTKARELIPLGLARLLPAEGDDPLLVETWL